MFKVFVGQLKKASHQIPEVYTQQIKKVPLIRHDRLSHLVAISCCHNGRLQFHAFVTFHISLHCNQ